MLTKKKRCLAHFLICFNSGAKPLEAGVRAQRFTRWVSGIVPQGAYNDKKA